MPLSFVCSTIADNLSFPTVGPAPARRALSHDRAVACWPVLDVAPSLSPQHQHTAKDHSSLLTHTRRVKATACSTRQLVPKSCLSRGLSPVPIPPKNRSRDMADTAPVSEPSTHTPAAGGVNENVDGKRVRDFAALEPEAALTSLNRPFAFPAASQRSDRLTSRSLSAMSPLGPPRSRFASLSSRPAGLCEWTVLLDSISC